MITFAQNLGLSRRTSFVGFNIAVVLAGVLFVVLPIQTLIADRYDHIAQQRRVLARLTDIASQDDRTIKLAQNVRSQPDAVEFLNGANEGVISADLQTRLRGMIQSAGANMKSARALPSRTDNNVKMLGARVETSGPISAVRQAIYSIENATPYHFVVGATLRLNSGSVRSGGLASTAGEPILETQLDVFAPTKIGAQP